MENKNERICCFFLRQLQFFVLVILLGRALCISFVIRANYVVSIVQTTGNNSRRHKWCRCTFCAFAANKRKLLEQVYKCCALADNRLRSRAYSIVVAIKRRSGENYDHKQACNVVQVTVNAAYGSRFLERTPRFFNNNRCLCYDDCATNMFA